MKCILVSCGTDRNRHPKAMAVDSVSEAYRCVRNYSSDELNYVNVTIHLVKEDLAPAAFSALVREVLQVDKAPEWGDRDTNHDSQIDPKPAKKHWNLAFNSRLCCAFALSISLALSGGVPAHATEEWLRPPEPPALVHQLPAAQSKPSTRNDPASQHQETSASASDLGETVKTAAIGTIVTIVVAAVVCAASHFVLCMFPL